jgi:chromosome segregation ATPase
MPHVEVQPNGKIEFVRSTSKHKSKSGNKHHPDSRDQKIADLQRRLDEVEDQKEELINSYQILKESKRIAVEEAKAAKAFKQEYLKYRKNFEESEDNYEDLHGRFERRGEEIKQKDKVIRQKDSEIRSKDKEIEELRVDKKVQSGTIKQVEDRNAALQDRVTIVSDEKRRLQQEVALRRANEEKLLADNKSLKEEISRLRGWVEGERLLALEKEARLRKEREEADRREADRREADRREADRREADRRAPPPRRRYDDGRFY